MFSQLKYIRAILTQENVIYISKNFKIKIYKTLIELVFLYDCKTWAMEKTEELRLVKIRTKINYGSYQVQ